MTEKSIVGANEFKVALSDDEHINVHTYQQIYNDITGKSENLKKWYDTQYQISLNDLNVLNDKLNQHVAQFHKKAFNCSIKVYYADESTDEFSSFERFSFQSENQNISTSSIYISYNLCIVHPETHKAQNYKININLTSPLAEIEEMLKDMDRYGSEALSFYLSQKSALINISYVDYNVAKTIQNLFENWINSLNVASENKTISILKRKCNRFGYIFQNLLVFFSALSIYLYSPAYFKNTQDFVTIGQFMATGFLFIYFSGTLGRFIGNKAAVSICKHSILSYIKLNPADDKLIEKTKVRNKKTAIKFILQSLFNLCLGLLTSILAVILFN